MTTSTTDFLTFFQNAWGFLKDIGVTKQTLMVIVVVVLSKVLDTFCLFYLMIFLRMFLQMVAN